MSAEHRDTGGRAVRDRVARVLQGVGVHDPGATHRAGCAARAAITWIGTVSSDGERAARRFASCSRAAVTMKARNTRVFVVFQPVARVSCPLPTSRQTATTLVSARKTNTRTCGTMKLNGDGTRPRFAPVTCHACSLPHRTFQSAAA